MGDDSMLLPHGTVTVVWRRVARARRINMRVDARSGAVVVTLPPRATLAAGRALMVEHAGWIAERVAQLPEALRLADGALLPLGDTAVRVRHDPGARGVALRDGDLVVGGGADFLARRVGDFLRAEARRRLSAAAAEKAGGAGLRVRRVVVKDTRTRWGSCTADGTLMFSWRLVMSPARVQDYVVAHEVAHLRHMDHGAAFWALVGRLTPHQRAAMAWLKARGAELMRVG